MSDLLGSAYPAFLSSYDAPRPNGLRVNTLKISPDAFVERNLLSLKPIPWASDGFYYDFTTHPGQHPYHGAGVYYLQEPSAMAVVHYLDPQPGERILDLAAAPGGKTTQIASRIKQQGLLWANEIHPNRARILAGNLERWGTQNTIISNESPDRLAERLPATFDRILLDAPCSGEGMFRKDPDAIRDWSPEHVEACAARQHHILDSASRLLKPGGRLVYSTCTFSEAENENAILSFLEEHSDFEPIVIPDPAANLGFEHSVRLPGSVRLYPYRLQGEGHFIAVLKRKGELQERWTGQHASLSRMQKSLSKPNTKHSATTSRKENANNPLQDYSTFEGATLNLHFAEQVNQTSNLNHFIFFGDHLYWNPTPEIPLNGLHILRPGLYLGEKKPGRFQPGHALALALLPHDAKHYVSLSPNDPRLERYLRGESWEEPGPNGWVLIGVDEFPLGWAKRVNGTLKNHYPKGLRSTL